MRASQKLAPNVVASTGKGTFQDGAGLQLVKTSPTTGFWVFKFTIFGRRREMGLGSCRIITLKGARAEAAKARLLVTSGIDPITKRDKEREAATLHTFEAVARACFESRKAELKNDGVSARWLSPLVIHVFPKIGRIPVTQLTARDVQAALAPIWSEKAATASKALDRVGLALKHAAAQGISADLNLTLNVRTLLGAQRHTVEHMPSMGWADVPAFYATLGDGVASLALKLVILTGARSGSIRTMRLSDIDFTTGIWTVPAENMKAAREWRCPLSDAALAVIEQARIYEQNGFLLAGGKGKPISDMAMTEVMRRAELAERPHGFRTSLRVWLAERTNAPNDVAEECLAHKTGNKVEQSYKRTDFVEQRAALMQRWADHVTGKSGAVVRLMA